jgi:hypothetical protein
LSYALKGHALAPKGVLGNENQKEISKIKATSKFGF